MNGPDPQQTAGDPMVEMRGVVKAYGDHVVLDRLDLDVPAGGKLVVIGPSGSGKTTILRVLMTLERPDAGTIRIAGEHLYHEPRDGRLVAAKSRHIRRVRRHVSMVFQHFNLFPHLSALDNVMLGPRRSLGLERGEAEARASRVLGLVGLAEKADARPAQLSGGQKQRVAIARALAMEPRVILFDEVTSALDPELVGEVLAVLRDLALSGQMTMVLVTHEMRFARDIADEVVMFDEGRIVEKGPPERIFTDPEHERTRSFLRAVLGQEAP